MDARSREIVSSYCAITMDMDLDMAEPSSEPDADIMPIAGMEPTGLMDPMDDLFGEAADGLGVSIPMPAAPLPPSLIFRIDDMQRTGCCS